MANTLLHLLLSILTVFWPATTPPPAPTYVVLKIVDGDTIDIKAASGSVSVRLLGMDTPEIGQCLADTAKKKLTELIDNNQVTLTTDPNQPETDKYGRLLRYVSIDNEDFSTKMLALGLARYYWEPKPYILQTQLKNAEISAKAAKLGLWNPTLCPPK